MNQFFHSVASLTYGQLHDTNNVDFQQLLINRELLYNWRRVNRE